MATDLAKLQGTWIVTSLQIDGDDAAPAVYDHATITVDEHTFTSAGMGDAYTGTITLGASKTVKTIDIAFTAGPPSGSTNRGIYRIDGDQWTMCLATRGDARPRVFETKPDSGHVLETFRRASAGEAKRARSASSTRAQAAPAAVAMPADGPRTEIDGEWAMLSAVLDGKPLAPDMVQWCTRITRGGVTKIVAGAQTMLDAGFTLDPKHGYIDYVNRSGKNKGKAQAGIYELAAGVLRICTAAPGKPRPADFTSTKSDGRSFTEWRFSKP